MDGDFDPDAFIAKSTPSAPAAFDPDAFIAQSQPAPAFDPDAFITQSPQPELQNATVKAPTNRVPMSALSSVDQQVRAAQNEEAGVVEADNNQYHLAPSQDKAAVAYGALKGSATAGAGMGLAASLEPANASVAAMTGLFAPVTFAGLNIAEFLGGSALVKFGINKAEKAVTAGTGLDKTLEQRQPEMQAGESIPNLVLAGGSIKNLLSGALESGSLANSVKYLAGKATGGAIGGAAMEGARPYVETAVNAAIKAAGGDPDKVEPTTKESLKENMLWGAILSGIGAHEGESAEMSKIKAAIRQAPTDKLQEMANDPEARKAVAQHYDPALWDQELATREGAAKVARQQQVTDLQNANLSETAKVVAASPTIGNLLDAAGVPKLSSPIDSTQQSTGNTNELQSKARQTNSNSNEQAKGNVSENPAETTDTTGATQHSDDNQTNLVADTNEGTKTGEGLATPSPVAPPDPVKLQNATSAHDLVGIYQENMNSRRADVGLPTLENPEHATWQDVHDQATQILAKHPNLGPDLVDEIGRNPGKALGAIHLAVLQQHIKGLDMELARKNARIAEAEKVGVTEEIAAAQKAYDDTITKLDQAHKSARIAGSNQGYNLGFLQAVLGDDMSLHRMLQDRSRVKGGKPLTAEETTKVKEQHTQIVKLKTELERVQKEKVEKPIDRFIVRARADALGVKRQGSSLRGLRAVRESMSGSVAEARKLVREGMNSTNMGVNFGPKYIKAHAIVMADLLLEGTIKVGDIAGKLVSEFGDKMTPFAEEIAKQARGIYLDITKKAQLSSEDLSNRLDVIRAGGEKVSDADFNRIAKQHSAEGAHDAETLANRIRQDFPEMSQKDVMAKLTHHGDKTLVTKSDVDLVLEDTKKQMKAILEKQDLLEGKISEKTSNSVEPSPKLKALQDALKVERKAREDAATKEAERAENLEQRLTDLQEGNKPTRNRYVTVDSERVSKLKDAIEETKTDIRAALKKAREKTGEQKDQIEIDKLQKRLDALESGETKPRKQVATVDSEKVADLKDSIAKANELKAIRKRLDELNKPKGEDNTVRPTSPEIEKARAELGQAKKNKATAERIVALEKKLSDLKEGIKPDKRAESETEKSSREVELEKQIEEEQKRQAEEAKQAKDASGETEEDRKQKNLGNLSDRIAKLQKMREEGSSEDKSKVNTSWEEETLQRKLDDIHTQIRKDNNKAEMANMPMWRKLVKAGAWFSRETVLAFSSSLYHISGAALLRPLTLTVDEMNGWVGSKLAPSVAKKAYSEGMSGFGSIATFFNHLVSKEAAKGVKQSLLGEKTATDLASGRSEKGFSIAARSHKMLKEPVVYGASMMERYKAEQAALKRGEFIDPLLGEKIRALAANKGYEQALMEDNAFTKQIAGMVSRAENSPSDGAFIFSQLFQVENPIAKMSANSVKEIYQRSPIGLARGVIKLTRGELAERGISGGKLLTPEEADFALHLFKKGATGSMAMIAIGYFLQGKVGNPVYDPADKKNKIPVGEIKLSPSITIDKAFTRAAVVHLAMLGASIISIRQNYGEEAAHKVMLSVLASIPYAPTLFRDMKTITDKKNGVGIVVGSKLPVPGFIQEYAKHQDHDIKRTPTNMTEAAEAKLPYLRSRVPRSKN